MKYKWFCLDLKALFDARVGRTDDDYAYCKFGIIEATRDSSDYDRYYDFCRIGISNLCCDGEQCKLVKVENDILTFISDGNMYEENIKDYYFQLTKEEAEIAGVYLQEPLEDEDFYGCDKCQTRLEWEHIEWVNGSCGFCPKCYRNWFKKLPHKEQERIIDGGEF